MNLNPDVFYSRRTMAQEAAYEKGRAAFFAVAFTLSLVGNVVMAVQLIDARTQAQQGLR